MQLTFSVDFSKAAPHLEPDQFGAVVAYASRLKGFHSVRVWRKSMEITVNLNDNPFDSAKDFQARLDAEVMALLESAPYFCPCGCGVAIALRNCKYIEEPRIPHQTDKLTSDEIKLLAHDHNIIGAIKAVRQRTGLGLKDAKDLCDDFRVKHLGYVRGDRGALTPGF